MLMPLVSVGRIRNYCPRCRSRLALSRIGLGSFTICRYCDYGNDAHRQICVHNSSDGMQFYRYARLPWHGLCVQVCGPEAEDACQFF